MMALEVQFQVFIMTIIFGMYLHFSYQLLSFLFSKIKKIRFFLELPFFIVNTSIYYCLLFKLNNGIFNIYLLPALLIGLSLYQKLLSKHFLLLYQFIFKKINDIIHMTTRRDEYGKDNKRKKSFKNI